jgi:hypothetical protein
MRVRKLGGLKATGIFLGIPKFSAIIFNSVLLFV